MYRRSGFPTEAKVLLVIIGVLFFIKAFPQIAVGIIVVIALVAGVYSWYDKTFNKEKHEEERRKKEEGWRTWRRQQEEKERLAAEERKRRKQETDEWLKAQKVLEERELKEALGFKKWGNFLGGVHTGEEYEAKMAKVFERLGYKCSLTSRSGDNGVDIIVYTPAGNYAVQCKFYHKRSIGNDAVQEVISGMLFVENCIGGMVVTNSTFTDAAKALAERHGGIKLLHHSEIPDYVAELQSNEARAQ